MMSPDANARIRAELAGQRLDRSVANAGSGATVEARAQANGKHEDAPDFSWDRSRNGLGLDRRSLKGSWQHSTEGHMSSLTNACFLRGYFFFLGSG